MQLSKLQDDNRALERLTKSKEAALLDAEREVQLAKIKAALVDDLQNKNQELTKQNDICQVGGLHIFLYPLFFFLLRGIRGKIIKKQPQFCLLLTLQLMIIIIYVLAYDMSYVI